MSIKLKKLHPNAIVPTRANPGDAGLDLYAVSITETFTYIEFDTGIAMKIPEGFVGLLFPRSSISNTQFSLANSVGVIDSGYTGPITMRFRRNTYDLKNFKTYVVGDKIGQLVIVPFLTLELDVVEELETTIRGSKGFGSSGA